MIQRYTWKEIVEMQGEDKEPSSFSIGWKNRKFQMRMNYFLVVQQLKTIGSTNNCSFLAMKLFYGNEMRTLKPRFWWYP